MPETTSFWPLTIKRPKRQEQRPEERKSRNDTIADLRRRPNFEIVKPISLSVGQSRRRTDDAWIAVSIMSKRLDELQLVSLFFRLSLSSVSFSAIYSSSSICVTLASVLPSVQWFSLLIHHPSVRPSVDPMIFFPSIDPSVLPHSNSMYLGISILFLFLRIQMASLFFYLCWIFMWFMWILLWNVNIVVNCLLSLFGCSCFRVFFFFWWGFRHLYVKICDNVDWQEI